MSPPEPRRLGLDGSYRRSAQRRPLADGTREGNVVETRPIRVFIVDNHPLVRRGLTYLINARPDLELAGQAKSSAEAVQGARQSRPDLVLFDLGLACNDTIAAIMAISADEPRVPILAITGFTDEDRIYQALKAGATGHLLRDASPAALLEAIHHAHRGESSLHPTMARRLLAELREQSRLPLAEEPLTGSESGVLRLLARGYSNQVIADEMAISEASVRQYTRGILDKLHAATRDRRALYAL